MSLNTCVVRPMTKEEREHYGVHEKTLLRTIVQRLKQTGKDGEIFSVTGRKRDEDKPSIGVWMSGNNKDVCLKADGKGKRFLTMFINDLRVEGYTVDEFKNCFYVVRGVE